MEMAEEKKTMTSLASMGKVFDVPKELQKTAYITSMEQYEKDVPALNRRSRRILERDGK